MTEETRPAEAPSVPRSYKWELLALLCLAFFFHQGDRAIFGVVATEIQEDLHLDKGQIGLVATILFWTIALMTPIAGYLGDVLRKKFMITGALLFWSSTTALTGLSQGLFSLAMLRSVATGGSESFYAPPAYALMARFHQKTRALALSIHQGALYVGIMTSGLFGGLIAQAWGWRSVFYVYGGAGILIGLLFLFRLKDERDLPGGRPQPHEPARPKWENPLRSLSIIFRTPTAFLLTTAFTAVVFVNNTYVVFAPAFLEEKFGLPKLDAGTYAMFYHHLAALVGVLIGGAVSDAVAPRIAGARLRLQTGAMFLGALAILYMSWGTTVVAACIGMALFGLFRGLFESNTHASVFEVIEPKYRSSAVGAMVMMAFLVGATAPLLMGELCDRGYSMSFVFACYSLAYFLGGVAVAVGLLVFYHKDRIVEEET
ncbi:MAG: MFS transporter [Planctomycetaceae bacterium]|jgi:MFS family permease|nr:MFS transporter [Planctomycetaceae bacterium]